MILEADSHNVVKNIIVPQRSVDVREPTVTRDRLLGDDVPKSSKVCKNAAI